ncbi:Tyrosine kinase receptor Cad96Ca [Armadillidium nasatum]|uniref:Tyrosine kinase receptor Cad96Ca n=1 Tax=Armadillidium nasatum TaxID=96803 RepID=A0A5N5SVZ0_9CRUS|nr:Tyrosine kinase receptor Cad96Ca [Armadillidium nasatum]
MQHLGQHPNIVTLLGCCTTQEPYHLVMEYVTFGKLLTFLRDQRSKNTAANNSSASEQLASRDLTKFAHQIASGGEYLQSRGVIHRDLAARNILVDHNKICKIADFGLARSVKDMESDIYEQKSKGPLPIRWMAPESLFMNIFTHKSDVWSYGILCWEIVTLGSTPYPGISAREVMRRVREGYRLERPEHCRPEFYKIVSKCWHQDHNKRPSFTTIKNELRKLLDSYSGWIDLENFQEASYYSMHQNNEEKL